MPALSACLPVYLSLSPRLYLQEIQLDTGISVAVTLLPSFPPSLTFALAGKEEMSKLK